jgi:hypothetical protein
MNKMSTLLVNDDTHKRHFDDCIEDTHSRVLPAIGRYVQFLLQTYSLDAAIRHLWSVDSAGTCISPYSSPVLDVYYDLAWNGSVTTIEAHVIPMYMRHVLRRKTQLLDTFNFYIETPGFHDKRLGATGRLVITRK